MKDVRLYTIEEGQKLEGEYVKCDDDNCDGSPCNYIHSKPHLYDDEECFRSCGHTGCSGLCKPV